MNPRTVCTPRFAGRRNAWSLPVVLVLWAFAGAAYAQSADARVAFDTGDFPRAEALCREALGRSLEPGAQDELEFLLAESLFHQRKYHPAQKLYDKLLAGNPPAERLRRIVERLHQIGSAYLSGYKRTGWLGFQVGMAEQGLDLLRRIVAEYPYEDFSAEDQYRIAMWYFEDGSYDTAEEEFRYLLTQFPESAWSDEALFRLAQCRARASQGPRYDPTPLDESKSLLREYILRYPDGALVPDAKRELADIQEAQAGQEFRIAQFYLRDGHVESARVYLRSIRRRYRETSWAARAQELLSDLDGR